MDLTPNDTPTPAPKKTRGCLLGFIGGCAISALLPVIFVITLAIGLIRAVGDTTCELATEMARPRTTTRTPDGILLQGPAEANENTRNVLKLELKGVITGDAPSQWYLPAGCDLALLEQIEAATDNANINALVIDVNSPGGGVTASDALYHALEQFKAKAEGRKVIVIAGDIIASGAYYFAQQADWIRLRPTTLVGSIGVIVPGVNLAGLAQRLGIQDNSIASGAAKDLGNPLKPINPEHNAILQNVVNALQNRFIGLVAKGRHLPEADVRNLADGRIFTPEDAVNLRLADDIGYADTLDAKAAELLGCEVGNLRILTPAPTNRAMRVLFGELPFSLGRGLLTPLTEQPTPTPQYRW